MADNIKNNKVLVSPETLSLEHIKWQFDGNTILHHYALDYEKLKVLLEFIEDNNRNFLSMMLMRNNKGKTPLDIALDNESPKSTEALLRKMIAFHDKSISKFFYRRFNDLFNMNIRAFHEFLDICYFKT